MAVTKNGLKVDQLDLDGNFIKRFKSIKEASEEVYGSQANISRAVHGYTSTAYGFKWREAQISYVEQIVNIFGLDLGQEFKLEGDDTLYRFTEENLLEFKSYKWEREDPHVFIDLIMGDVRIQR